MTFEKKDYFYLAIVIAACVKITFDCHAFVETMLADESYYLERALQFNFNSLFSDGFVYFLWLKMVSFFVPDPLALYCFNYALMVSINPVLLYFFSRKVGQKPFLSALFSLFFLVSTLNITTWPYVTRFAAALILLTMLTILTLKTKRGKFFAALAGQFLLVYVRPEFLLPFAIFLLAAAAYLLRKLLRSKKKQWGYLMLIPLLLLIFVTLIKSPFSSQRSIMAFGQHYSVNLQKRENLNINPWANWEAIMMDKFKTNDSLMQAVKNNPSEIVAHVFSNFKLFIPRFFYQFCPSISGNASGLLKKTIALWIFAFFGIASYCFIRDILRSTLFKRMLSRDIFKLLRRDFFKWVSRCSLFYILPVLFIIPPLASIFIIYPRTHYLVLLSIVLYMFMIRNFPPSLPRWFTFKPKAAYFTLAPMAAVFILVYFLPWTATGEVGLLPSHAIPAATNITRIRAIKKISVKADVKLFSNLFQSSFNKKYFRLYTQSRSKYKFTFFYPTQETLNDFINKKNINMIYVNRKLLNAGFVPPDTGFTRFDVPSCNEYILVKNDII